MSPRTEFTGKVVMHSTRSGFPGPKEVDLKFVATFAKDGTWRVEPTDFGDRGQVVVKDVDGGIAGRVDLVVTLERAAVGTFNSADGAIGLDARFAFAVAHRTSTLTLRLDTGTHELANPPASAAGSAVDARGAVKLAGKQRFANGWLHGNECLVLLEGILTPSPRP